MGKNKCCKFPFIYTGRTHHTCVEVEGGDGWCATSLDQDMEYVHGLWGYCSQECFFDTPTPRSNSSTTISSFLVEDVTEISVTDYATSSIVSTSSSTADTSTLPSTQPSSTTTHSPTTSTSAVSTSETSTSSSP